MIVLGGGLISYSCTIYTRVSDGSKFVVRVAGHQDLLSVLSFLYNRHVIVFGECVIFLFEQHMLVELP